jgi:hypothetical protein
MSATIYEDLEDAIVIALAPIGLAGTVEVVLFPDDESEKKKAFSKPRISVSYHSFTGGDQLDTGMSIAEKSISVQVMFEAKKTRGPLGIYDLEVQAEAILNGLELPNYKRFTIGQFTRNERTPDGIWVYNLIIKTEGVSAQSFDDITPRLAPTGLATAVSALPPKLINARVDDFSPNAISLHYNKSLNPSIIPVASDFVIGLGKVITAISIISNRVYITVDSIYDELDFVIITYNPGATPIQDTIGNLAASLLGEPVLNYVVN